MKLSDIYTVNTCSKNLVSFNYKKYILFITTLIVTYILYTFIVKSGWEGREKSIAVHIDNVNQLIVYSTVVFVFGNYSNTFDELTAVFIPFSAVIFGWIAELPFMKTSLTSINKWSMKTWSIFLPAFIFIILIMIYIYSISKKCNSVIISLGPSIFFMITIFILYFTKNKDEVVHPHHWQIGWVLSFMTRYNSPISKILGGVFLGIFVQGISMYGPDKIIY